MQTTGANAEWKDSIAIGLRAIQDHDPSLGNALQRLNEVPDALISSVEFQDNFSKFQTLHVEHCDAEETRMRLSSQSPEQLEQHIEEHFRILGKIYHVYFDAVHGKAVSAQDTYEMLVDTIYRHILDFDMAS